MMHKTKGWHGLRTAVIALGLVAWASTSAQASRLNYNVSGQIDPTNGVSGTNVVSFVPITPNTADFANGATNAGLGNFILSPLADGKTTTYTNTPFKITFLPSSYDGTSISSNAPVQLTGVLNGVVNGPSSSTVAATFDKVPSNMIALNSNTSASFSLPTSSLLLVPSTTNSGTSSVQGLLSPSAATNVPPIGGGSSGEAPVPEPSTIALFLTTVGGLGFRRYVLARRAQSRA
jgi:hypothetical protein